MNNQYAFGLQQSYCRITLTAVFFLPVFLLFSIAIGQSTDRVPENIPADIIADWEEQDRISSRQYSEIIEDIIPSLSDTFKETIEQKLSELSAVSSGDPRWRELYLKACHFRRISRMQPYMGKISKIVYTKHYTMGGLFQGFLEGLGDNRCTNYSPGASLCLLSLEDYYPEITVLLDDPQGVIKEPDVSYDGKRVLFAWSKNNQGFHLYEMEADNPSSVRQITDNPEGLRVSDFEPCYLVTGDILFQSSRCFQLVDCFYNIASNLYMCDKDGNYLRRIGFDQVQTFYPTMMDNGTVLYTRWEYSDRSQVYSMGLFTMNPDGTHQNELYGNQSWWPTSIIHARGVPGTGKVLAVLSGHHTAYSGELAIIDPNVGRQQGDGITMLAPVRTPTPIRRDNGGVRFRFQTPYPLDERYFLTGWRSSDNGLFGLYFMDINGNRELLVKSGSRSCNRPVPLAPRETGFIPASTVDYSVSTGTYTMEDVYIGTGMEGVERGTAEKLRVVALDYRVDNAIGFTFFRTDKDDLSAHTYTPIARSSGSWDVKRVLGEVPIAQNGSASFTVPACTPVFFQVIDTEGSVIQTMRSWSTLQPNETFSCVGCHEDKNSAPATTASLGKNAQPLEAFHGAENRGFSYPDLIQPIWDKNCVSCHDRSHSRLDLSGTTVWSGNLGGSWLTPWKDRDNAAKKNWTQSYLNLTEIHGEYVSWIITQSPPEGLPPYYAGSSKSPLVKRLRNGHKDVDLTQSEMKLICAWIDLCIPHSGNYTEGMSSNDERSYIESLKKRQAWETIEEQNILQYITDNPVVATKDSHTGSPRVAKDENSTLLIRNNGRFISAVVPQNGHLTLVDPKGRVLFKSKIAGKQTAVDIPITGGVCPGVYIVHFTGENRHCRRMVSIP